VNLLSGDSPGGRRPGGVKFTARTSPFTARTRRGRKPLHAPSGGACVKTSGDFTGAVNFTQGLFFQGWIAFLVGSYRGGIQDCVEDCVEDVSRGDTALG